MPATATPEFSVFLHRLIIPIMSPISPIMMGKINAQQKTIPKIPRIREVVGSWLFLLAIVSMTTGRLGS